MSEYAEVGEALPEVIDTVRREKPEPIGVRVAIQGRKVVVMVGGHGISLFPGQALELGNMIRGYANQVLHAEHESLARERRAARGKRK